MIAMRALRVGMLLVVAWAAGCDSFGEGSPANVDGDADAGAGAETGTGGQDANAGGDAGADDSGNADDAATSRQKLYRDAVTADDPVAYYRMGDAAGSATADTVVGNRDAILSSPGPTFAGSGSGLFPASGSMAFDGEFAEYAKVDGLSLSVNGLTFELWIFFANGVDEIYRNIAYHSVGTAAFGVYVNALAGIGASRIGGGTKASVQTNAPPTPNVWHHVVVKFGSTGNPQLYVDGTATGAVGGASESPDSAGPFYFGARGPDYFSLPSGTRVTEVAVYNFLLSEARITAHYNLGKPP